MLAASPAAVKFDVPSTPEQRACSQAIDRSLDTFWLLVERLHAAADEHRPIHQVEETLFRDLLAMGRSLLQAFLALSGDGDVGPTLTLSGESPSQPTRILPRLDEPRARTYLSIFGEVLIRRIGYGDGPVEAVPLDARLHLPQRQYSYLLQRWLGAFVVDDAHAEAVKRLQTILGIAIAVKASEDLNREQASDVEPFQDSRPGPRAQDEEAILVVTADCKGVPLVRSSLAEGGAPPTSSAPALTPSEPHHRRGKGEKANKKRMAAVGAVYTIKAFPRTAEEVIDEVCRREAAERRPVPRNKRVRAELMVGKVALFLWLADEVLRRDPEGTKPVVFLSDGERALHEHQGEFLPEGVICILDLFHVLEHLWKSAWCFFDEATEKKAAEAWVQAKLRKLLEGQVGSVIRGLRVMASKRKLKGKARKTVNQLTGYLERNRQRMRYDEYLAAGYPIGSGVVEGACRHLVKDRMERAGMRWRREGAQAMLDLRATYLNNEWEAFWTYHVEREDDRLYGKFGEAG
jgi:hypothetical protein